jgi:hypothetical protein
MMRPLGRAAMVSVLLLLGAWPGRQARAEPATIVVGRPILLDTPQIGEGIFLPAGNDTGPFVLAWSTTDRRLVARAFDAYGQARTGVLELARPTAEEFAGMLASDMDGEGGFLVVWYRGWYTGTIEARRFNPDGSPATPILVLSEGSVASNALAVALRPDGSFVVAGSLAGTERLEVRFFGAAGNPLGPSTSVSDLPYANAWIDADDEGRIVVAYTRRTLQSYLDAWARLFDGTGAPRSAEIHVSPPPGSWTYTVAGARLLPDGGFNVAYGTNLVAGEGGPFHAVTLATFDGAGRPVNTLRLSPPFGLSYGLFLGADRPQNLATLTVHRTDTEDPGRGLFRMASAGGFEVGVATIEQPQFPPAVYETPIGLVATGIGAFNVLWHVYPGNEVYVQSLVVPPDIGPPTSFHPVSPCRLVDTRLTLEPLGAGHDRVFPAVGRCEIPPTARTLAVNVAAVASTAAGQLRFYRPDRPVSPLVPLRYPTASTRSAFAMLALDDGGRFAVRAAQASGSVDVVVDVTGYFE